MRKQNLKQFLVWYNVWLQLAAFNDEGQSKWSEVVTYRTKPDRPAPPPKPQIKGKIHAYNFRVVWGTFHSVLTDDEIKVWPCFLTLFKTPPPKMNAFKFAEPPKDNGGAEITKYIVEIDDGRGNVLLYIHV